MCTNTLRFLSSLNVSDQVSHPYKTTNNRHIICIINQAQTFSVTKSLTQSPAGRCGRVNIA
jgi:hypothetical protein